MANWGITDLIPLSYTTVFPLLISRDEDAATGYKNTPVNPPTGALRYNRTTNRWEEYDGTGSWVTKVISISGGGTGGGDAAAARQNLGIGTMGIQGANSVAITGGTITGLTALTMTGNILFQANNSYNIGTKTNRAGKVFIGGGLVVPVGADKWVPA